MNQLVSVIIPCHNAEQYIREAIQSVFAQTYKNIEVIVIDDGSVDKTLDVLNSISEHVHLIIQTNQGSAAARNRGANAANGFWLAFLDADDVWVPKKLENQLKAMTSYNWSYTDMKFTGGINDGIRDSTFTNKYEGNVLSQLVKGNFISTSSVVIKKQIFLNSTGFDESLRSIQDWELWTRIAANSPIVYVDEPLGLYRIHPHSTSRDTRKTLPNHLKVIDIIFSRVGTSPEIAKLKPYAKATSYGICSHISEEEGDIAFSFYCALCACGYGFLSWTRWLRLLKISIKYFIKPLRSINKPK